jgi:hypothetical protein
MEFEINYLAILASGIIMMVLGYLWYGPLFGKPWMKLAGITKSDMEKSKKNGEAHNASDNDLTIVCQHFEFSVSLNSGSLQLFFS